MAKINKIQLDGASYDIRGLIPEVVSSLPVTGEEDMLYLTPAAEPGTRGVTVETSNGYAQIANAPANAPITLETLSGNATQKTLSGKNLFTFDGITNPQYPSTGLTIDETPNSVTTTAETTQGAQYYGVTLPHGLFDATKTYTLSCKGTKIVKGTDGQPRIAVRYRGSNDNGSTWSNYEDLIMVNNPAQGTTYDLQGSVTGYTSYQFFFYNNLNTPVTLGEKTSYVDIQLELGNTKTDFEPYCGGSPMPNPQFPSGVNVVTGAQTVKITGKNLLDKSTMGWGWINGSGSIIANYQNALSDFICCEPSTTYMASIGTPQTGSTQINFAFYDINKTLISRLTDSPYTSTRSAATPDGCHYMRVWFYRSPDWTDEDAASANFMLELGDQATTYEPYHGQSYEVNLGGTNLLTYPYSDTPNSPAERYDVVWTDLGDGTVKANGTPSGASVFSIASTSAYITIKPNTVYTMSGGDTSKGVVITFEERDASNNVLVSHDNITSLTFTSHASATRLTVGLKRYSNSVPINNFICKPQLQLGSVATPFVPYTTYQYELAKIGTYQDYIWNDGGTWKIHKEVGKVVLDGTDSDKWSEYTTPNAMSAWNRALDNCYEAAGTTELFDGLCDYYSPTSQSKLYNQDINGISYRYNQSAVLIKNTSITTKAGLMTWFSAHNTTVYYALATPTDTAITDSDLIEQLSFVASLYEGVNNIMLVPSADPQGEMTLVATEYDPQQRYDEYVWVEGEGYEKVGYGSVDTALSLGSTNPVQNKVITEVIGDVESILRILNSGNGV